MSVPNVLEASRHLSCAVEVSNLAVHYNGLTALSDVSICVDEGEYLGIIGPNGGGKTTFLKALLGLVPTSSGHIRIFGKKPGQTGRLIGYVPQITAVDRQFPACVYEVVLMGRLASKFMLFHRYRQKDIDAVDAILERVGIHKLRNRGLSELSGGEFQRVLIARALAVNPKLLLLDEPTASVDATSRESIFGLLNELNDSLSIILVTHDLLAISSYVKTLACLNGNLVYHGSTELNEEVVKSLYGCPIDLIAHGVPHRVLRTHGESE